MASQSDVRSTHLTCRRSTTRCLNAFDNYCDHVWGSNPRTRAHAGRTSALRRRPTAHTRLALFLTADASADASDVLLHVCRARVDDGVLARRRGRSRSSRDWAGIRAGVWQVIHRYGSICGDRGRQKHARTTVGTLTAALCFHCWLFSQASKRAVSQCVPACSESTHHCGIFLFLIVDVDDEETHAS